MPSLGSLLAKARLIAPEILIAECANILWKKVRGKELSREEARLAARLLQGAALELLPIRSLLETASRIAIELDHPAYDCVYIALAMDNDCRFVTADERLVRKVRQPGRAAFGERVVSLTEAG
jgi:predicted nucleic acid-binding protein